MFAPKISPDRHHAALDVLKWLGLGTMLVDHAGRVIVWWWVHPAHLIGRLAFPCFALVVAQRLALAPELWRRYLPRLLAFGVLAQPAYQAIAGEPRGNVLFTLAAAVAVGGGLAALIEGREQVAAALALVLGLATAPFVEFGWGVVGIPVLMGLARFSPWFAAVAIGPVGLLVNLGFGGTFANSWPALLVTPLALAITAAPLPMPRMTRWFFYGFYPAHLFVLWAWAAFVLET